MKKLKFLITGTGRSGTVYMCRLLTSMGIMCGHESIFTPYGLEEAYNRLKNPQLIKTSKVSKLDENFIFDPDLQIAESSYMSAPFLDNKIIENTKIIHVIRNPIKVISSTYYDANFFAENNDGGKKYANFVELHLPQLQETKCRLEKVILYYILWNEMIIKKCKNCDYILYNLESGITNKLLDFIEVENTYDFFSNDKINCWHKRHRNICFEEINDSSMKKRLASFMEKLGYLKKFYL